MAKLTLTVRRCIHRVYHPEYGFGTANYWDERYEGLMVHFDRGKGRKVTSVQRIDCFDIACINLN